MPKPILIHSELECNIPFNVESLKGNILNVTPSHVVFEFTDGYPWKLAMLSNKDPLCQLIVATLSPYYKGLVGLL